MVSAVDGAPGGEFRLDESLERLHESAAKRLPAEKRPFPELGAAPRREAGEEIAPAERRGFGEIAARASGLAGVRVDALGPDAECAIVEALLSEAILPISTEKSVSRLFD